MKPLSWLAITGLALLTGCTSMPKFVNKQQPGDAALRCENIGFGSFVSGNPLVSVDAIDGAKGPMMRKGVVYHLRPGKHELALEAATGTMREAKQYLEFEAAAGHKYLLTVSRKDNDFFIDLADETNPAAVMPVTTIKVPSSSPNIFPIFIPVK